LRVAAGAVPYAAYDYFWPAPGDWSRGLQPQEASQTARGCGLDPGRSQGQCRAV